MVPRNRVIAPKITEAIAVRLADNAIQITVYIKAGIAKMRYSFLPQSDLLYPNFFYSLKNSTQRPTNTTKVPAINPSINIIASIPGLNTYATNIRKIRVIFKHFLFFNLLFISFIISQTI